MSISDCIQTGDPDIKAELFIIIIPIPIMLPKLFFSFFFSFLDRVEGGIIVSCD